MYTVLPTPCWCSQDVGASSFICEPVICVLDFFLQLAWLEACISCFKETVFHFIDFLFSASTISYSFFASAYFELNLVGFAVKTYLFERQNDKDKERQGKGIFHLLTHCP